MVNYFFIAFAFAINESTNFSKAFLLASLYCAFVVSITIGFISFANANGFFLRRVSSSEISVLYLCEENIGLVIRRASAWDFSFHNNEFVPAPDGATFITAVALPSYLNFFVLVI